MASLLMSVYVRRPYKQKAMRFRNNLKLFDEVQKEDLAKLCLGSVVSGTMVEKWAGQMTDEPAGGGLSTGGFDFAAGVPDKRGPDTDSEMNTGPGEVRYKKIRTRHKSRKIWWEI